MNAEQYLKQILSGIITHPEAVNVVKTVDELGVLLTLSLHKEDMKHVIGRAGETAKSIRNLLRINGMQQNARVNLKILEPQN